MSSFTQLKHELFTFIENIDTIENTLHVKNNMELLNKENEIAKLIQSNMQLKEKNNELMNIIVELSQKLLHTPGAIPPTESAQNVHVQVQKSTTDNNDFSITLKQNPIVENAQENDVVLCKIVIELPVANADADADADAKISQDSQENESIPPKDCDAQENKNISSELKTDNYNELKQLNRLNRLIDEELARRNVIESATEDEPVIETPLIAEIAEEDEPVIETPIIADIQEEDEPVIETPFIADIPEDEPVIETPIIAEIAEEDEPVIETPIIADIPEEEQQEEELYEVEIKGKMYYVSNEIDSIIYIFNEETEGTEEVGKYVNGKAKLHKKK